MAEELRVSGRFTQIARSWAEHYGYHDPLFLDQLEILAQQDFVPVTQWHDILKDARSISGNDDVGLQIGAEVRLEHVGVLGYLVLHSENLADALQTYVLNERHFYGINFAELICDEDKWTIVWPDIIGDSYGLLVQSGFAVITTFMRQRFPRAFALAQAGFTGPEPADLTLYQNIFDCPLTFGGGCASLVFDKEVLFQSDRGLLPDEYHNMRQQQIDATSNVTLTSDPFLRRLHYAMLKHIPDGAPISDVAQELNCSVRTLQRRLGTLGFTYQSILQSIRQELAHRYLQRTSLSLTDISLLLGYSDQSAFTRAYKHWTDISPGTFRLQNPANNFRQKSA